MDPTGDVQRRASKQEFRYICPCCKETRTFKETCFQVPEFRSWRDRYSYDLPRLSETAAWSKRRDWACLACIGEGKAALADTSRQVTDGIWTPRIPVYFEQQRQCAGCGATFGFSPAEQKAWFEEYRIPIEVAPRFCRACRAVRRAVSARDVAMRAHKVAATRRGAPSSMEALAEFYKETDKPTKADYWKKKASKAWDAKRQELEAAYAQMNVNSRADVQSVMQLLHDLGETDTELGRDLERRLRNFIRKRH